MKFLWKLDFPNCSSYSCVLFIKFNKKKKLINRKIMQENLKLEFFNEFAEFSLIKKGNKLKDKMVEIGKQYL